MAEAPPDQPVDLGVDVHHVQRPQERRDVDARAVAQRDDGDDGGGDGAEGHQRNGARVRLLALGDDQGREEDGGHEDGPHREEDDAQVEGGVGPERHVRGEEDVGAPREHRPLHHQRPRHHQREGRPSDLRSGHPGVQQDGGGEVEHRHLEEDDEEDEHVHAVDRQQPVEQVVAEQVDDLPAGEEDQDRGGTAHEERHRRRDRVGLDEPLGVAVDLEAGRGAPPEEPGCGGEGAARGGRVAHGAPPGTGADTDPAGTEGRDDVEDRPAADDAPAADDTPAADDAPAAASDGVTRTLPTMRWWPTPQNSLQTIR